MHAAESLMRIRTTLFESDITLALNKVRYPEINILYVVITGLSKAKKNISAN